MLDLACNKMSSCLAIVATEVLQAQGWPAENKSLQLVSISWRAAFYINIAEFVIAMGSWNADCSSAVCPTCRIYIFIEYQDKPDKDSKIENP